MLDCSQRTLFEHPDGLIDKYLVHNMQASASVTHHRGEEVKGLESLPFLSSSHTHTHTHTHTQGRVFTVSPYSHQQMVMLWAIAQLYEGREKENASPLSSIDS